MEKKHIVFISSTIEDLKEERNEVIKTILKSGNIPTGQELFTADTKPSWAQIEKELKRSSYYICIIKTRYGSLIPKDNQAYPSGEEIEISYTEREYDYATEQNIPRFSFVYEKNWNNVVECADEVEKCTAKKYEQWDRLHSFIEKVKKNNCASWTTTKELCLNVSEAIHTQFPHYECNRTEYEWIRNNETSISEAISSSNSIKNFETCLETWKKAIILKKIESKGIELSSQERWPWEAWIGMCDEEIWKYVEKKIYIDSYHKAITLTIHKGNPTMVTVKTELNVTYANTSGKKIEDIYNPHPRFQTKDQASSYRHDKFAIIDDKEETQYELGGKTGINCIASYDINNSMKADGDDQYSTPQFPHTVMHTMPSYTCKTKVTVKDTTTYDLPAEQYFSMHQITYPCRHFLVEARIENNEIQQYAIKSGVIFPLKKRSSSDKNGENSKDRIMIERRGWIIPFSGCVLALQKSPEVVNAPPNAQ